MKKYTSILIIITTLFGLFIPTVSAQSDINSAYLKILNDAVEEYGEFRQDEYGHSTGVGYAKLFDFDNDGIDELLYCTGYSEQSYSYDYQYHIYQYKNNEAVLLTEGSMEAHGGTAGWKISILYNQAKGRLLTYRHDGSFNSYITIGEIENGKWMNYVEWFIAIDADFSKGDNWEVEEYYVAGDRVSKSEYENRLNSLSRGGGRIDIECTDFSDSYFDEVIAMLSGGDYQLDSNITVLLDGVNIEFDQSPIIYNDRTLVPLRVIFEALGAVVEWYEETSTVVARKDDITIKISIGENCLYKNNATYVLDVPAMLVNNRTLVPVRAISEAFGCNVEWNDSSNTVLITSKKDEKDLINYSEKIEKAIGIVNEGQKRSITDDELRYLFDCIGIKNIDAFFDNVLVSDISISDKSSLDIEFHIDDVDADEKCKNYMSQIGMYTDNINENIDDYIIGQIIGENTVSITYRKSTKWMMLSWSNEYFFEKLYQQYDQ